MDRVVNHMIDVILQRKLPHVVMELCSESNEIIHNQTMVVVDVIHQHVEMWRTDENVNHMLNVVLQK